MQQGDGNRQTPGQMPNAASRLGSSGNLAGRPSDANPRTPTPPFSAGRTGAPTPTQRLTEARSGSRRVRHSPHPDGPPAPLPTHGAAGRGRASGVMQRFSGTGVAPRERVQQQERRARATTLLLAGIAVLLIACSALLLFNPFLQHPGFGFDPGHRFVREDSNVPLIVEGTEPPTVTPTSSTTGPTPTATPHTAAQPTNTPAPSGTATSSASGTATPGPTATAAPTATPKPTATIVPSPTIAPSPTIVPTPGPVTVEFTAASQTISNNTWSACPSGCDVPATATTTSESPAASAGPSNVTGGWSYRATDILFSYTDRLHKGFSYDRYISPTTTSGQGCQNSPLHVVLSDGQSGYWQCSVSPDVSAGAFNGSQFACSVQNGICWTLTYNNPSGTYTDYTNTSVSSGDCTNLTNAAITNATNWGNGYNPSIPVVVRKDAPKVSNAGCSPSSGTTQPSVYPGQPTKRLTVSGHATGSVYWEGFDPSQVPGAVGTALDKKLTSGYAWKSGTKSVCSTPSGGWTSPGSGTTFSVTCAASELEYVNWTAAQITQFQNGMAGVSAKNAVSQCQSLQKSIQGVTTATSCTITPAGSALPSDPTKITVKVDQP